MTDIYRVWVQIERTENYGTEQETQSDILPFPLCSSTYETQEEAEALFSIVEDIINLENKRMPINKA